MALKTKTCYAPVELYLHSPNTPSWRGAQLKHRDNFTFYLLPLHTMPICCLINAMCCKPSGQGHQKGLDNAFDGARLIRSYTNDVHEISNLYANL